MRAWLISVAVAGLVAGIVLVLNAAPKTGPGVPLTPGPAVQPGQPQVTTFVTQNQTEVQIRSLQASLTALTADLAALKERVAALEADMKTFGTANMQ